MTAKKPLTKLFSVVLVAAVAIAGWFFYQQNQQMAVKTPTELRADNESLFLIAGSELKDLEPYLNDIYRHTGVQLGFHYSGTLDGVDSILAGEQYDGAWFSHGKYLSLSDRSKIKAQEQIMLSPVVMGIKTAKAKAWGWDKQAITWQDIADKAQSGELNFAMTNPSASNSGFTALMGVTAAFAGTSDAPTEQDIAVAEPKLKNFFKGQKLTSGSSGWLASQFVKEQNRLDGMINYESVLMQLNHSGQLNEPLTLLYPTEGIITADYPLMLLNSNKREAFDKVVAYLKSEDFQQIIMEKTDRRPGNINVALSQRFHQGMLVELPFPNSQKVIDEIIFAYLDDIRIPASVTFVLDTSGSMEGQGITQLKAAMQGLVKGNPNSAGGKFSRFLDRESVTIAPFSGRPKTIHSYTLDKNLPTVPDQIATSIQSLQVGGKTAIYDALKQAYQHIADEQKQTTEPRYYSIVLMTDGQNTVGDSLNDFNHFYQGLPENLKQVKTFTVLFGKADEAEMKRIAELTGGRQFDGRKGNLSQVFKKIRGYQ